MDDVRSLDDPDLDHEMVVEPDPVSGSNSTQRPTKSTSNGIPHLPHTPLRHSQSLQHLGSVQQAYGSALQTAVAPTPYPPSPFTPLFYYHPSLSLPRPTAPLAFQTPSHPPLSSQASARVERLEALRDLSAPAKRPRTACDTSGVHAVVAAQFVDGLFADVRLDKVPPQQPHLWHQHATTEERVLVVLRAIEAAGFSLPEFLSDLFKPGFNQHPIVYHRVASFLRMRSPKAPRPVDIVTAMYEHPKAHKRGFDTPLFPSLPRHAWPPQDRLLASRPSEAATTTTEALILDFALKIVLRRIDAEADELLLPRYGLVYSTDSFSWELLHKFSMASKQALFAQHAPALFAIMSTVAVNRDHRKRLEHRALSSGSARTTDEPDADAELEADVEVLPEPIRLEADSKAPPTPRDPWLAVTAMIMMLLVFRYRRAIMFPLFIGVLLFTCNAHRDVFRILNRIGLCVAYSTCLDKLSVLAQGQNQKIIEWARWFQAGSFHFQLVYDNVNKRRTVWQKTIASREEFQSGTAATLIKLEDVPPGAMSIESLEKHAREHPRSSLTYDELREDINWEHLGGVGAATILRIWVQWVPALARHRADVEELFTNKYRRHRLPLRKSEIRSLRCSAIDESTTEGSNRVLNDIINQLCITLECLATVFLFVCGDQLTIDRVRKLKLYFGKMKTPVERRAWARPVIQLWHMKWAWQKVIVKLNWSNVSQELTYGLRFDCFRLERQKYNPTKCDYHQTHHLLRDTFEAQILEALRLLCQEKTGVVYPPTTRLVDGLAKYFDVGGSMAKYEFTQLAGLADQVYDRYICLAAHDDALGFTARNETVYGPSVDSPPAPITSPTVNKALFDEIAPVDDPRTWCGDRLLANTTNFMRQTFWYMEFCAAVSEGDIGRVFEIIKVLRFSFWGAGSTNYGNELFELACHFLKEYPPDLCIALLNNYLVNPSGRPGHWHEIDLLQEHFNFWLKRLFQSKTMSFESNFLKEVVGLNLCGFNEFRDNFTRAFGLKPRSGFHPDKKRTDDINRLGDHYREHQVLQFSAGRTQAYKVPNEFEEGAEKVRDGQLATFLRRTSEAGYHGVPGAAEDADAAVELEEAVGTPANPIVMVNGASDLSEFVDTT